MQKYGKIKELGEALHVCKGFRFFSEVIVNSVSETSPIRIHLFVQVFACLGGEPGVGVCFLPL